mgnify:CR=1 FL=1
MGINLLENHFRRQYLSAIFHLFAYAAGGGFLLCLYLLSVEHGYRPRLSIRGIVPLVGRWRMHLGSEMCIRDRCISPLYPAKSTEKEVSRLSAGFCSYTVWNTCESVIINLGGLVSAHSVSFSLSVVQLITRHFLSRSSRIVCTWGRISRPLGA